MADSPKQDRDLGLSRERQGGRFVTKYTPEMALRICERVAEGETLKAICERGGGLPARQTFHRWLVNNPDLREAYQAAREISAHSLEETALMLADDLASKKVPTNQIRALDVAMAQYRWSAGKRNPQVYSEKATVSFQVPIQINTSIDLGGGDAASGAVADHPDMYNITAEIKVEGESVEPGKAKPLVASAEERRAIRPHRPPRMGTRAGRGIPRPAEAQDITREGPNE